MTKVFTCLCILLALFAKAQTTTVCGQAPPTGWITTAINGLCNGNQISRTIERIDNLPAGSEVSICGDVPPAGWITISATANCAQIGTTFYNGRRIKKIDGLATGTELFVCGDSPPAGWITISMTANCAQLGSSYLIGRTIKKIEGLAAGTELNICGDSAPAGWVTLSLTANCAQIGTSFYIGRKIIKHQGMAYGTILQTCADAVPSGWTVMSTRPNCARIGNTIYSGYTIKNGNCSNIVEVISLVPQILCPQYDSTPFSAYTVDPNPSYQWTGPNGFTSNQPSISATIPGVYTVNSIAGDGNCRASASVTKVSRPVYSASINTPSLLSCSTPSVSLSAITNGPTASYKWNGPNSFTSNQSTVNVSVVGVYSLTAISTTPCPATATATVSSSVAQYSASVNVSGPLSCTNTSVTLSASTNAPNPVYKWIGPNNFSITTAQSALSVTVAGVYNLTVISGGCSTTAVATVNGGCQATVACESVLSGPWNSVTTWSCGRVPLATDEVTISHVVTIPASTVQPARKLTYKANGRLIVLGGARLQLSP